MPYSTYIAIDAVAATPVLALGHRAVLTAARLAAPSAATDVYLQLFDAASIGDVTVGTTKPKWWVLLDQAAGDISGGDGLASDGLQFDRGIVIACTTGPENSTGASADVRLAIQ